MCVCVYKQLYFSFLTRCREFVLRADLYTYICLYMSINQSIDLDIDLDICSPSSIDLYISMYVDIYKQP